MHLRNADESIDLAPGTSSGVLYSGMNDAGSRVYFTSRDNLTADDSDTGADLFVSVVDNEGGATLERVSSGSEGSGDTDACDPAGDSYSPENWNVVPGGPTDCSVVGLGGGAGIATRGNAVFFLSPEQLDGSHGVAGAPNLYRSGGTSSSEFVATLESGDHSPVPAATHPYTGSFGAFSGTVAGAAIDDSNGDTYVFDANDDFFGGAAYVQKFDAAGNPVSTWANASKVSGISALGDGSALGQPAGVPSAIVVDNNPTSPNYRDVFIPDFNSVVYRYDGQTGALEDTIGLPFEAFGVPTSIAIDPTTNNIYVARASLFGGFTTVFVFDSDGNPVGPTSFPVAGVVFGIAVDSGGHVYVADGSGVQTYSTAGVSQGALDENAAAGVAVDSTDGHIYVDEQGKIREYNSGGEQVGSVFGSEVISNSVSFGVASGRLAVSDPAHKKVARFWAVVDSVRPSLRSPTSGSQRSGTGQAGVG